MSVKYARYKMKQYKATFSGRVQGVGFRFTAVEIARRFSGLTGYVKNLPSGRVEVVAECDKETFQPFIKAIQESSLGQYIEDVTYEENQIRERTYSTFEINV